MRLPQFDPNRWTVGARLYATGKAWFRADGDPAFADAARAAFMQAGRIRVYVDAARFREEMVKAGAAPEVWEQYLQTCEIDDAVFFIHSGEQP